MSSWDISGLPHLIPVPVDDDLQPIGGIPAGATGTWLFVAPAKALLNKEAPDRMSAAALDARPDIDILYADSAVISGRSIRELRCKPDFNPALLWAKDYIGLPLLIRASAFARLGGLRPEHGAACWYEFCLRAHRAGTAFGRIATTVIGVPTGSDRPDTAARKTVLEQIVAEEALPFEIRPGLAPGAFQLRRIFRDHPPVSLVIPTRQSGPKDGPPHIIGLLRSIEGSSWPLDRIRIVIGDDVEDDGIYREHAAKLDIRRIVTTRREAEPFNYAAKMNRLWREADTELLVLMNDDMTIRSADWLEALFTFAMEPDVGGVGARLLFPDGRIQHAGMVGGLYGGCGHPWWGLPAEAPTYQDWANVHRDWCAVTGAAFATRRSVLEAANGFDERFSLEFNDVDLCLRLKTLGYRIVYTPHAELIHHERASRGETLRPGEEVALFLKRWRDFLADDPMYSPQLVRYADVQPRAESYKVGWSALASRSPGRRAVITN